MATTFFITNIKTNQDYGKVFNTDMNVDDISNVVYKRLPNTHANKKELNITSSVVHHKVIDITYKGSFFIGYLQPEIKHYIIT